MGIKVVKASYQEWLIPALLIALSAATRMTYAFLTDNFFYGGDTFIRVEIARALFQYPVLIPNTDWLFGHFWMLLFPMWLFDNFEFAPRLVSLIPGILFPLPIFYLGKRLLGEHAAIIACVIYGFALPQLILSGVTLTAIPFSFFFFVGLFYFIKYQDLQRRRDIAFAALFLMLANSIRLEGWMYSFILGVYFLIKKRRIDLDVLIYASLTSLPILLFMWDNYAKMGHPLHALVFSDFEVSKSAFPITTFNSAINYIIPTFFAFSGISNIFGPVGAFIALMRKEHIFIISLFIVTYLFLLYKVLTHTLVSDFRYFTVHAIFSYLLSGYCIVKIISLFVDVRWKKAVIGFTLFACISFISKDYIMYANRFSQYPLRFSQNYWRLINKIKDVKEIRPLRIYLDSGEYAMHNALAYHARINIGGGCITYDRPWLDEIFTEEYFKSCIERININAIILLPNGGMVRHMNGDESLISHHFTLTEKYIFGEYKLYLVKKRKANDV